MVRFLVGITAGILFYACGVTMPRAVQETSESCPAGPDTTQGYLLALSGGGYRAALFHAGALWRLNEVGILRKLGRVSSVSGGSITAGVLAANWRSLTFDQDNVARDFSQKVVEPLMLLTSHTLDLPAALVGLLPFTSAGTQLEQAYKDRIFGDFALADLPEQPDFIINATNFQTGAIWRFGRRYMGDASIGVVCNPRVSLAQAVAASSGFPPILSPVKLDLGNERWVGTAQAGTQLVGITAEGRAITEPLLSDLRRAVILVDGGVADNLGLETNFKHLGTVLVSDGAAAFEPDPNPSLGWLFQLLRIIDIIHRQPSQLRTSILEDAFKRNDLKGTAWTIIPLPTSRDIPLDDITKLASIPTRLRALDTCIKQSLINWGYHAADKSLQNLHFRIAPSGYLPFPSTSFGSECGNKNM